MSDLIIRGGTVIDGTGAKGVRADVRVKNGLIAEIGSDLRPATGEKQIDASGAYVTPGFIDCHTHYDGPMWWNPRMDPLPGHGSTTAVMGLCGFSAAPMAKAPADRDSMIGIFSYIEDIPRKTFENNVPWTWNTWPEYYRDLRKLPVAVNVGALMGHINLRIYVMGEAAWERAANANEIAQMAQMFDEALRAGAMGISTNFFDIDSHARPVPTQHADDAELTALMDVLARYKGRIVQFALNVFTDKSKAIPQLERMVRICQPRGIRMQYLMVPLEHAFKDFRLELMEAQHRLRAQGADIWPIFLARPITVSISFELSFLFRYQNMLAWDELVNHTPADQKLAKLANPEWRAKARHQFDTELDPMSVFQNCDHLYLNQSENEAGPVNITLGQYAKQTGLHPSDAMADWVIKNGLGSSIGLKPLDIDEDALMDMVRYRYGVTGANDAGAHGQLFCGAAETSFFFAKFVRDQKRLSIEEAVHSITGRVAEHYGLSDRGLLVPGKRADIAVFALDEIDFHPEQKVRDVPNGMGGVTWRYTRAPGPVRATIVNGTTTFEKDVGYTKEMPGQIVVPGEAGAVSRAAE